MPMTPESKYLVEAWYDGMGNPLQASITLYTEAGSWEGCIVQAAEPFDSITDVLSALCRAINTFYGVQLSLFDLDPNVCAVRPASSSQLPT